MDPLDLMIDEEQRSMVRGEIRRLPDTERLVFGLVHVESVSERDTSAITGQSRKKVRAALERARSLLRARLAP